MIGTIRVLPEDANTLCPLKIEYRKLTLGQKSKYKTEKEAVKFVRQPLCFSSYWKNYVT